MMQVYYTERIEGNCHWFEFAPQLRWSVTIDGMELRCHRLGGDAVMEYTAQETAGKFWQMLQELAQSKREAIQFIKVDDLNPKTLNEELNHLQILYRNHFKRQRRKNRKRRSRRKK